MKAIRKLKADKGATLTDIDIPVIKDNEVLVKVIATSICGTDVHIYKWDKWSQTHIKPPQTLGHEVAGEIVEIGKNVKKVKIGDYISAETHIPCEKCINCLTGNKHICTNLEILGVDRDGAFAEYVAIPESVVWINDKSILPAIASIQEPLGNAVFTVLGHDNNIAGKTITIIGDGPTALFAIAVAKLSGASKIFHIGMFKYNMNIGKQLGSDYQLFADDNSINRIEFVKDNTNGYGSDIVLEMAGAPQAIYEGLEIIRRGGRYSAFGITPDNEISINYNANIVFKGIEIHGITGRKMFDTWIRVRNMLSSGKLNIYPVITHMFKLEDFEKGFEEMMRIPRKSAKIILFPKEDELKKSLEIFKNVNGGE